MEQIKSKDDYDQCSRLINMNHMLSSELINLKNQIRKNDKNIYSTHKNSIRILEQRAESL
jgi:hypothetical protein